MRRALFPAIALFAAAALGVVALRGTVDDGLDVKPAVVTDAEPEYTKITPHQIRSASLRKEGDGHYWATARVNDDGARGSYEEILRHARGGDRR